MAKAKLYTVKGPGGKCVMNEVQAMEADKKDDYEIIGIFEPNRVKPVTDTDEDSEVEDVEEPEDNELLDALKGIRSNADLADFIDENEIDIDPADYDSFKELKDAVAEKVAN